MAAGSPEIETSDLPDYMDIIDRFLHRPDAPYEGMLLAEFDGYLAGIVTSVDMISPSEWLPSIWNEGGSESAFEDEKHAQEVLDAVMQRYNDIITELETGCYAPIYDMDTDDTPIWEIWLEGFWRAVIMRQHGWASILTDQKNPIRQYAAITLTRLHQLSHRYEVNVEPLEGDEELLDDAADLLPAAVEILYQYRNDPVKNSAKPKAGRNDPCPCGSGKKFKKCCLQ